MSNLRRKPLTQEQADELKISPEYYNAIQKLEEYIQKNNKTQAIVAKELSISDGLISAFLAGKYEMPHNIIPKVQQLMKMNEKRLASPKEPEFKMTSISQQVTNIITYCHLQGKIGVAYGDAGIGKTMAIKQYVKENPEAIMITVSPCYATITGVNELLAEELRIKEKISRRIFAEAVNKLKGSNRVIIIDEAQHLTVRVINHLRSITDESGVGIAFIGNEEIYTKMQGSGQAQYAQLFSRIGDRAHVLTNHIKLDDIKLIFEDACFDNDTLKALHGISRTNYGIRGAVNVYVNTIIAFKVKDYADITAGHISKMAKEMNIA